MNFSSANTRGLSHAGTSSRRHKGLADVHTCDGRSKWAIKSGLAGETQNEAFSPDGPPTLFAKTPLLQAPRLLEKLCSRTHQSFGPSDTREGIKRMTPNVALVSGA